jgi:DNA polymerase I-like protein with 3'-5' exonuclease and polymerase domains
MTPKTPDAYQLFHQGAIALAQIESNGMWIDVPYVERTLAEVKSRTKELTAKLGQTELAAIWRRRYGAKTNFDSHEQIGTVLFDVMKHPKPKMTTGGGRYSTDEKVLAGVDDPGVQIFL